MSDKVRDMKELFLVEATKYNVFPLDNSFAVRAAAPRPSSTAGRTVFTYFGESSGLPYSSAPNILGKSYSITAEVEIPQGGAEGMINTLGGRFGGHGLYLLKGKPVFVYNFFGLERFRWEGPAALAPGKHTVVFDFKYDGPGFAKGGTGVLSVDGKEVASKTIPHTIPFLETFDETFDVGMDTRTGVDDKDYQPPFRFTGKIDKLTVKLVPLSAAEEKLLQQKAQETRNKAQ
jgi:arylsulfatase